MVVVIGLRRGVDGPATGGVDAGTSRGWDRGRGRGVGEGGTAASDISMSSSAAAPSSPSDEDNVAEANSALLLGMTRAVAEAEARRGRFLDGVSGGADTPSSSSDADTMSESVKATLRFAALCAGVRVASRIADLVGEAERECEGVLVGVFCNVEAWAGTEISTSTSTLAFFLRISLIVARIDSIKSTHSSSIIL